MLSARNSLIFCATTLGVVGFAGCWVGSTPSPGALSSFGGFTSTTAGASAGGAPSSVAGAPSAGAPAGGDMSGAGAPAATGGGGDTSAMGGGGASSAGAPAGGASAGGTAGDATAGTGGAPAGGAPAGGSGGAATCPASTGTHQTVALDRSCWNAVASDCAMTTANMNPPQGALDVSLTTRFSTGVTMPLETAPFTYQIDMTTAVMITGVTVNSVNATDWAPMLEVDVSTDGQAWTPVACGSGASVTDLSFTAVSARYVRLTQMGSAATGGGSGWWSIYDLNVYGSMGTEMPCATPGPGATGSCTTSHTT
jgi:F5/8 type C domain